MKIKKIAIITITVIVSIVLILSCVVYFLFVRLPEVQNRYIIDINQIKTKIRETDGMVMVYIPAGEFEMGYHGFWWEKPYRRLNYHDYETPKHKVYLDDYWIDQTEVTVAMFRKFVVATGYQTTAEREGWGKPWIRGPHEEEWRIVEGVDWQHPLGPNSHAEDNHPVCQVSWEDAAAYCDWVGAKLPTEAQWEKAARGTDGRIYPWGNQFDGNLLNYCDTQSPTSRSHYTDYDDGYAIFAPVGSYPDGASPYGVLDMAGNLWEWVFDWYDADYYQNSPDKNPLGPENGEDKTMRGGSWYDVTWVLCVFRHQNPVTDRYSDVGFRCVVPIKKGADKSIE